MSKRTAAKKARRNKRRATRDRNWIPARVVEQLEIASELEDFDARLTERGWEFDVEVDDETGAAWYWPPSNAEVEDADEQIETTAVLLTPQDGGEIAHVVFVGTLEDYQFNLDELFDHIDVIEAYRIGDPLPTF